MGEVNLTSTKLNSIRKTQDSGEARFVESCKLQNELRKMQYDETLCWKQRKLANEFFKEIGDYPNFPFVDPSVLRKMIQKVGEVEAKP